MFVEALWFFEKSSPLNCIIVVCTDKESNWQNAPQHTIQSLLYLKQSFKSASCAKKDIPDVN